MFQCSVSVPVFRQCSAVPSVFRQGDGGEGGCRGKRAKKGPKQQKNFFHISGTADHMIVILVHMCKMMLQQIFSFFKILIFGVFRGIKGKKRPKTTNFSLFCSISQELWIMSSRF